MFRYTSPLAERQTQSILPLRHWVSPECWTLAGGNMSKPKVEAIASSSWLSSKPVTVFPQHAG